MKKELKEKWVKALRSGKYRQTRGYLRDETGFCCLGVLYDVAGKAWKDEGDGCFITEDKSRSLLCDRMLDCFGLDYSMSLRLANMNDGREPGTLSCTPKTFNEIADYIEVNL